MYEVPSHVSADGYVDVVDLEAAVGDVHVALKPLQLHFSTSELAVVAGEAPYSDAYPVLDSLLQQNAKI